MPIDAAYAAYTDACTFFLDENGVCIRVVLTRRAPDDLTLGGRTRARAADQCVGAQYVASLVAGAVGGLVSMPQAGAPMLFAYVGADGRIGVIRTGPLVRFENLLERITLKPEEDQAGSGAYESYAARSASATELFDEDDDDGTTLPRHGKGRPVRPPAPPWQALRRAGMRFEAPQPVRDSAPTWKDVQPPRPRKVSRVVAGKR